MPNPTEISLLKAMKKNNRITSGLLDLEPAMEKRRTAALLSSLEKLNEHDRQLAGDWITLNILSVTDG